MKQLKLKLNSKVTCSVQIKVQVTGISKKKDNQEHLACKVRAISVLPQQ